MRSNWTTAAFLCASAIALNLGCGHDEPNRDLIARRNAHQAPVPPGQAPVEKISLIGCLKGSPGNDMFELHGIQIDPQQSDPQATSTFPQIGITEGAWVNVTATDQLRALVGQRVQVTGQVREPGRAAVGTTGASVPQAPSGDKTQPPTQEHHASKQMREMGPGARDFLNSKAGVPLIATAQVQSKGETCK